MLETIAPIGMLIFLFFYLPYTTPIIRVTRI